MKTFHQILLTIWALSSATMTLAQGDAVNPISIPVKNIAADSKGREQDNVVVITGVRFAYPLVQKWIDEYNKVNPDVQIIIESRGTNDPSKYDLLVEAYEPEEAIKKTREYVYVARYAVVPVANSQSAFAKTYSDKGLNEGLIKQIFFHDMFADKENEVEIKAPFTVYTRLQKAGVPITFTKYFGFQQKDIKGKAIAGSDEHLLKAVLRDSTALSYFPLSIAYDRTTGKPVQGLTVLPVDLNGNNKVNDEEKFYDQLASVLEHLEEKGSKNHNVPAEYLHLSVDKNNPNTKAVEFLRWVIQNGQKDLHAFGYLLPEVSRFDKEKFEAFASQHIKQ
jgi:phosphate transport system substrate-binding protein